MKFFILELKKVTLNKDVIFLHINMKATLIRTLLQNTKIESKEDHDAKL